MIRRWLFWSSWIPLRVFTTEVRQRDRGPKSILSNVLKYLKVEPVYTDEEKAEAETDVVTVPDLIGKSYASAAETREKAGSDGYRMSVGK